VVGGRVRRHASAWEIRAVTVAGPKRKRESNDAARVFVERMIHNAADLSFCVGKTRLAAPPPGSLQIDKLLRSNSMRRPPYPLPADTVRTVILNGGRDATVVAWSKLAADRDRLAERAASLARLDELRKAAAAAATIDLQGLGEAQALASPVDFDMETFLFQLRDVKDIALMLSRRLAALSAPMVDRPRGAHILRRAYVYSVSRHWSERLGPWPRARSGWYVDFLVAGWRDLGFPSERGIDLHQGLGKALETIGALEDTER
jgi:hypothetical protein